MSDTVLILGPTKAGKTTLLGALSIAAPLSKVERDFKGSLYKYTVRPQAILQPKDPKSLDDPREENTMKELGKAARRAVAAGSLKVTIGGSIKPTAYAFDLEVDLCNTPAKEYLAEKEAKTMKRSAWLQRWQPAARMEVYDGPGGSVFGEEYSEIRATMVEKARKAKAVIFFMDATNPKTLSDYFYYLDPFLQDVAEPRLPFERMVFVQAKADQVKFGVTGVQSQLQLVEETSPTPYVVEQLSKIGLGSLLELCSADCEIRCGWTSAYGFIPSTGAPNFQIDPKTKEGGFAHYSEAEHNENIILDQWQPFRVSDPFIFAVTGRPCHLELLEW